MQVLVAGCGWLGTAVAIRLLARGDRVTGLRRDPERAEQLRRFGIEPLALDLADPAAAARIPAGIEAVIALQSASGPGLEAYRQAYVLANATLLRAARRLELRALVCAGSSGVFTQRDGSEVFESTPPTPGSGAPGVLAEAERQLLDAAGVPVRLVRLSGLYGPGRAWMLDRVRSGALGLGPGDDAWLNSVHQDDAVTTLLAALDRGRDRAIYHGTDAEPMRRRDVVRHVAARLGIAPPVSAVADPADRPNRRISGAATRAELGIELRWPSLREGLEPLLG
jgi:nucleoside-diphosphate-sugar epimerase